MGNLSELVLDDSIDGEVRNMMWVIETNDNEQARYLGCSLQRSVRTPGIRKHEQPFCFYYLLPHRSILALSNRSQEVSWDWYIILAYSVCFLTIKRYDGITNFRSISIIVLAKLWKTQIAGQRWWKLSWLALPHQRHDASLRVSSGVPYLKLYGFLRLLYRVPSILHALQSFSKLTSSFWGLGVGRALQNKTKK